MNQVHKETLTSVDNALGNRASLDVEIFGMEGIPEDVVQAHNQRIITQFYQAEAERRAATGNPGPGGAGPAGKKPKFESPSDLKKRLAEHKARMAEQAAGGGSSGGSTPVQNNGQSPALGQSPAVMVGVYFLLQRVHFNSSKNFFVERLTLPSPASYVWWWLLLSRTLFSACGSLPTTIQPAAWLLTSRFTISTSAIPATAAIPCSRLPTTKFPRCSSPAIRGWITSRCFQSISTASFAYSSSAWVATSPTTKSSASTWLATTSFLWRFRTSANAYAAHASRSSRSAKLGRQWMEWSRSSKLSYVIISSFSGL